MFIPVLSLYSVFGSEVCDVAEPDTEWIAESNTSSSDAVRPAAFISALSEVVRCAAFRIAPPRYGMNPRSKAISFL